MSLTVHLLVKNNEQTIGQCLQSLVALNSPIFIGNQGSTDGTLSICRKFNTTIVPVLIDDCSIARNTLIDQTQTPWAFYLHPWEFLEKKELNGNAFLTRNCGRKAWAIFEKYVERCDGKWVGCKEWMEKEK